MELYWCRDRPFFTKLKPQILNMSQSDMNFINTAKYYLHTPELTY